MKKVTVLFGSPHQHSYTAKLLNSFLDSLKSSIDKIDINIFSAYKENINPCIDCKKCCDSGICIYDDMNNILESINESHIIIIAFPIYNSSVPAPLKSIIDRFQQRYNAKFFGNININYGNPKKAIILTTQGANKEVEQGIILAQIKPMLRLCGVNTWNYFNLKDTDNVNFDKNNINKLYNKQIKNILANIL